MKKIIIISAVNLVEGGTLAVLQECLGFLSNNLSGEYKIIALVNRKELFFFKNIKCWEFPKSKKSWIKRLYYEYYYFAKLARRLNPFLWLSLHDITPNVTARRLAVYCHNPSPFYKLSFKEAVMDLKFALFNTFYKYLYRINIKKNNFVIVQQDWLRQELKKLYKIENIIVSYPEIQNKYFVEEADKDSALNSDFVFFYPAFPRVFKNFEVICQASEILLKRGIHNFQIIFTIFGNENRYTKYIYNSFGHIKNIKFTGRLKRDSVFELYNSTNCVIFPSKLETWGMPITEAKLFKKPIILADLEYARETLGSYDKVKFFNPYDFKQLAGIMSGMIKGTTVFEKNEAADLSRPFAKNWKELFDVLLN